jgi:signal transduction histidine kinase
MCDSLSALFMPHTAQDSGTNQRPRVLIVDDTVANLIALEALVNTLGCGVVTAASGAKALELASMSEYAVILLDVMMPDMDGFETLRRLRLLPSARTTPVVFMTAQSLESAALERAYALGAVDYITKPISPPVLLGKVRAFVAMFEQAQEIQRQTEALRAKDRYLGVLAHDLRTPLSVVGMTAVQLSQHADPAVQVASARLTRAALRMQSLSDDLLETARMALGALRFKPERIDLREMLAELLSDFQALHPHIRFASTLPDALVGMGDRLRLQQAMSNLLTNAVKYGSGWIELRVEQVAADRARIHLANECGALTPEQLENLFAPFAQGASRVGGVGLGLYIVREIARLHGGDAFGSWRDGRVTFTLELSLVAQGMATLGDGRKAGGATSQPPSNSDTH